MKELDESVVENTEGEYVIFFHADWAQPSVDLFNEIIGEEITTDKDLYLCVVDENPDWTRLFDIRAAPALVWMVNGEIKKRQHGYTSRDSFNQLFREVE